MDDAIQERIAAALESLADSFAEYCKLYSARLDHEFPAKRSPRESTVTRLETEEDRLRKSLGDTGESLDEWTTLGPREREVVNREKTLAHQPKTKKRSP